MSTKTARKRIGNGEKRWNGEVRIVRFESGQLNHRRRLEPLTARLIISAQEVSEALACIAHKFLRILLLESNDRCRLQQQNRPRDGPRFCCNFGKKISTMRIHCLIFKTRS